MHSIYPFLRVLQISGSCGFSVCCHNAPTASFRATPNILIALHYFPWIFFSALDFFMYFGVWEEVNSHFNGVVFVLGSYSLSQVVIMHLERKG